jgi:7-cyano-7-deazaguanine reductase
MEFSALGHKVVEFAAFDTFAAPGVSRVRMVSDEVTALCPVTGQPDWYTVTIDYVPDKLCLESKSLKLYFHSLRQKGIFCESLARRICDEVGTVLIPLELSVTVKQKPRGGISIEARAEWI